MGQIGPDLKAAAKSAAASSDGFDLYPDLGEVAAALQNTAGIVGAAVAAQVDRAESARSGRSECTLSLQWSKAAAGPDSGEYP
jgi:hypothetical protein